MSIFCVMVAMVAYLLGLATAAIALMRHSDED